MISREGDSISSHRLLILIIVLLVAIIGLSLIRLPLSLYLLNEQPDKTFTSIEYVDIIKGEDGDLLIIHLKNSTPISKYTLTPSANIRCKEESTLIHSNSTRFRKTLRIACIGDFVDQSDDIWNGTLVVFLVNNHTETHILSVKARNIGCLGCQAVR